MGFEPKLAGGDGWVDPGSAPPSDLITMTMKLAVMSPTQRHGELVADLAAKRPGLGKAQMVSIGRGTATHQTRLGGYEFAVLLVAQADGLGGNPAATGVGPAV